MLQTQTHSESFSKFAAAFVKAQSKISGASKDKNNPAFKSKYADLESVTDAIRPAAAEFGLAYFQSPTLTEDGKLYLVTTIIHESGEWLRHEMIMPISKMDPQGFGSAMTYARRYALSAAFGVAPEDDDGNAASGVTPKPAYTSNAPAKPAYSAPAKPAYTAPAKPATPATPAAAAPAASAPPDNLADLIADGAAAAKRGMPAYETFFMGLSTADKKAIGGAQHDKWKALADAVKAAA